MPLAEAVESREGSTQIATKTNIQSETSAQM